jgi:peptidyl-prolyl cis-trans isomerase SurA
MISAMMRARNVTPPAARSAAICLLLAAALPAAAHAQNLRGKLGDATPAAATPAPTAPNARPLPRGVSESVAAVVNDDIISTYDLGQRVRLLIATSGVQPNEQTLPQFEREALISLIDERLQLQELHRVEKEQKFTIIATDEEVNEELEGMARQNNMSAQQFLAALGQ